MTITSTRQSPAAEQLLEAPFREPSDLHPLLHSRWSTRAFEPAGAISPEIADRLLEAARWSPSAQNSQPWRFVLGLRGTPEHEALFASLMGFNQAWAGDAAALLLVASVRTTTDAGGEAKELRWADLDCGQALAHLTVQAASEGLVVHTMGGVDLAAVRERFAVPEGVEPLVVAAIGHQGDVFALDEQRRARETTRSRLPFGELALPLR